MGKGNNGLTGAYMFRQLTGITGRYQLTTERLMSQFYRGSMESSTDGTFKAVCLSGIRTENNTGSGKDKNDASIKGSFIEIIVRPLTPFGDILPDPRSSTDPKDINASISIHKSMWTARSDFEFKDQSPIAFGQIVNCYFEHGSITNSDFSGLRFAEPQGETTDPSFVKLASIEGVITGSNAFANGLLSLLGGMPNLTGDIYTRAQELREQGVKIRGKSTPKALTGDVALAKAAGIPVNILRAVRLIESGAGGANVLRFEPHIWFRKLSTNPPKGNTKNDKVPYSLVKSETNRSAFVAAYGVNQKIAVKSTSFGLYQVLGGHGIKAYGSASSFWTAFQADPAAASDKMLVAWFKANKRAVTAANAYDFTKLAEAYNGSQQAKHYYDALIAEAYITAKKKFG